MFNKIKRFFVSLLNSMRMFFFKKDNTIRLFVDMDGTLAQWMNVDQSEIYKKGYFLNLPPHQEVVDAINRIKEDNFIEVYILSCYLTDSRFAYNEKQKWVEKYLPGVQCIFVPGGFNKADAVENFTGKSVTESDILLDDYSKNLHEWKTAGGTAVKLLNGINHTKGTWKEEMIRIGEIDIFQLYLHNKIISIE